MANMDIIGEMAKANMGNIRDKMFFAINKFDALDAAVFQGDKIGKYLDKEFYQKVVQEQLNAYHIYPMVAVIDVKRMMGDQSFVQTCLQSCADRLNRVTDDCAEQWKSRVAAALKGEAVVNLRQVLIKYLKEELAFERLRDIERALRPILAQAQRLLGANADQLAQARNNQSTAVGRIREFIAKAQTSFEAEVLKLSQGLPHVLTTRVFPGVVKPRLDEAVQEFNTYDLNQQSVQRRASDNGSVARSPAPLDTKQFWIDWSKAHYSDRFVNIVTDNIVGPVQGKIDEQVAASKW